MPNHQTPAAETSEMMSNQAIAQDLLAQGLPTQSTDVLALFLQFLANEVVKRLAQGEALESCSALMDRYARFDSLRQRGIALKLRAAKAKQKAAAEIPAQAGDEANTSTTTAAEEPLVPSPSATPPPREPALRSLHLSRQQRRALLRSQSPVVGLTDGLANAS